MKAPKVYVIDSAIACEHNDFDFFKATDEEIKTYCEKHGKVYSLKGFEVAFNNEHVSTIIDFIKII